MTVPQSAILFFSK